MAMRESEQAMVYFFEYDVGIEIIGGNPAVVKHMP